MEYLWEWQQIFLFLNIFVTFKITISINLIIKKEQFVACKLMVTEGQLALQIISIYP